jgi:bacillithiol system protein YtxJ
MFNKLFRNAQPDTALAWTSLTNESQINSIIQASFEVPQLIFKHSTRCSISQLALNRLERDWAFDTEQLVPHYLDLLNFRVVSNAITQNFNIEHESPQVLLIQNGKCVYYAAQNEILVTDIDSALLQKTA